MKFLFAIILFSLFAIGHARFIRVRPIITTGVAYNTFHHNIHLHNHNLQSSQLFVVPEIFKIDGAKAIDKIRVLSKNGAIYDDEILKFKKSFPLTFSFYGHSLTVQLLEYLPEVLFPAIGKAAKRPELDHFCIIEEGKSYAITKKDESLGLLLHLLAKNKKSSLNIVFCPLDLNPALNQNALE